jgi:uncharacterized protein (DUF362 family)
MARSRLRRHTGMRYALLDPIREELAREGKIRIASAVNEVDLVISMPKLKNHELVYFTGAIKNTLGFVPGFSKARQHALHHERLSFASFLVDLSESITPDFFLMDGITGMEGPGPGQGFPVKTEVLLGSANPVALDIIASTIAGYDPMDFRYFCLSGHYRSQLQFSFDSLAAAQTARRNMVEIGRAHV